MAEAIGRFKPGENLPGFAKEETLLAGRVVMIAADKSAQGDYQVKMATANIEPSQCIGVVQRDSGPTTDAVTSWTRRVEIQTGGVAFIKAAGAISAGNMVYVSSAGEVKAWESGKLSIGVAMQNIASGALGEVKLSIA